MSEIKFRAWHKKERKFYFRAYQKISHVLLCNDDCGENGGKGMPANRASYDDCIFLQSATVFDKNGIEIFEGDLLRIKSGGKVFEGVLESVPDMFKSRRLHPLNDLLSKFGLSGKDDFEVEIIGNRYSSKTDTLAPSFKS